MAARNSSGLSNHRCADGTVVTILLSHSQISALNSTRHNNNTGNVWPCRIPSAMIFTPYAAFR